MRKKVCFVGIVSAAAGLFAAAPATAADQDNDGINVLNNSNISVVPIQACGNNIVGPIVPVLSSQDVKCTQATIEKGKDSAQQQDPRPNDPPQATPQQPDEQKPATKPRTPLPSAPKPAPVAGHHAVAG